MLIVFEKSSNEDSIKVISPSPTSCARCNLQGKRVTMSVIDVCRFKDGMMVEHWGIPDRFALLHQLGLLPQRQV